MRALRIGNGCGFWGDSVDAPILLAEQGRLDYLTLEYLAELTMSILALQKQKNPQAGYAHDFLEVLGRLGPLLQQQPGLKIITNAGGMNPAACAAEARKVLGQVGLEGYKIGVVSGDDLLPQLDALLDAGHPFTNLDTGKSLAEVRRKVVSANVYFGARPIVAALQAGAQIVITGRVADASLTVAPALHEFGWKWEDWQRLGAATVAGHLIECGAQATGGLWTHWAEAPDLANVGYPIAEFREDGEFRLTKPTNTGGRVNRETVTEQLLYEVGDPAAYLTPDVVADFTSVELHEEAKDVVRVRTARGKPATDSYKVSIAYRDGYTASGTLAIFGENAAQKARISGQMILERLKRAGCTFARSHIECIGANAVVPGVVPPPASQYEVMLRVAVHDPNRAAIDRFSKEFAPLVTSGLPATTGYTTGRPQVREVFAYWPALLAKTAVQPVVTVE
jgi:hypothetical protein